MRRKKARKGPETGKGYPTSDSPRRIEFEGFLNALEGVRERGRGRGFAGFGGGTENA